MNFCPPLALGAIAKSHYACGTHAACECGTWFSEQPSCLIKKLAGLHAAESSDFDFFTWTETRVAHARLLKRWLTWLAEHHMIRDKARTHLIATRIKAWYGMMETGKTTWTISVRERKIAGQRCWRRYKECSRYKLCRDELNVYQPRLTLRSSSFVPSSNPLFAIGSFLSFFFFFSYTDRKMMGWTWPLAAGVSPEDEPVATPGAFSRAQISQVYWTGLTKLQMNAMHALLSSAADPKVYNYFLALSQGSFKTPMVRKTWFIHKHV